MSCPGIIAYLWQKRKTTRNLSQDSSRFAKSFFNLRKIDFTATINGTAITITTDMPTALVADPMVVMAGATNKHL